jgi:hypothetical protein
MGMIKKEQRNTNDQDTSAMGTMEGARMFDQNLQVVFL